MAKLFGKRNCIIAALIILLLGMFYFVYWRPQPVKVVNHYLKSVQNKDAQDAYPILHIQNKNSKLDFETFKGTLYSDPLIEYKINGSSKLNENTYQVLVDINMNGWETDRTFEVRRIDGNWKIVF